MRYAASPRKFNSPSGARRGAVLILALLVLALITTMGVFAATRSSVEQRIAGNTRSHMTTFYMAEAGLNNAKQILISQFGDKNVNAIALGNQANWTWLLDGSSYTTPAAMTYCEDCSAGAVYQFTGAWLAGGVQVVNSQVNVGNNTYVMTVTAWDNDEYLKADDSTFDTTSCTTYTSGGNTYGDPDPLDNTKSNPAKDCDALVIIRAVAKGYPLTSGTPSGTPMSQSIQEMMLGGTFKSGGALLSGLSQEFANEGKTSTGIDVNEIDFGAADFGSQTF